MKSVAGAQAVVTGAASGIGRAIAIELARQGCNVAAIDINEDGLNETAELLRSFNVDVLSSPCDLTCINQLEQTAFKIFHQWPGLNILVNNAGIAHFGPTEQMSRDDCTRMLDLNLGAAVHLSRIFLPRLLTQPQSHIVNISSMFGLMAGRRLAVYSASKFALIGFTQSLRFEYGRAGLGVSAVCPGFVRTKLLSNVTQGIAHREQSSPPAFLCTTPERIAKKVMTAIRYNRRQVIVTPLARSLYFAQRFAPWMADTFYQFGRRRKQKKNLERIKNSKRVFEHETGHQLLDDQRNDDVPVEEQVVPLKRAA